MWLIWLFGKGLEQKADNFGYLGKVWNRQLTTHNPQFTD